MRNIFEIGDSPHEIIILDGQAELHRFENKAGVPYSAVYVNGFEEYSCEREREQKMLNFFHKTNKRDMGITFFEYMMKSLKKDSPAGDLARDMDRDKANFPRSNTRDEIMSYLSSKGACSECLTTFEKCYKRYESYKRRQYKEAE